MAGFLGKKGLLTYPSPLRGGLLERLRDVLVVEVLPRLGPTDLALFARVGGASRAAAVASCLPRAGAAIGAVDWLGSPLGLRVSQFVGSVARLAWAWENGCPREDDEEARRWGASVCASAAVGGHLEVLIWARDQGCLWEEDIEEKQGLDCCCLAAGNGHLEVLQWLRAPGGVAEHGCPWDSRTCEAAACDGHLEALMWARENGCDWDTWTCALAASNGHLEVLMWARQHGCPWAECFDDPDTNCCARAAAGGHLAVLRWLREHDCPWNVLWWAPGGIAVGAG